MRKLYRAIDAVYGITPQLQGIGGATVSNLFRKENLLRTEEFYENTYKRDSSEVSTYADIHLPTSYEKQLGEGIKAGAAAIDASHWYYTSRATMMHDLAHNHESLEAALNKITANVLMISCTRDYLQPTIFNKKMVDMLTKLGKNAELFTFESEKGHMGGVIDTHLFDEKVREFLNK